MSPLALTVSTLLLPSAELLSKFPFKYHYLFNGRVRLVFTSLPLYWHYLVFIISHSFEHCSSVLKFPTHGGGKWEYAWDNVHRTEHCLRVAEAVLGSKGSVQDSSSSLYWEIIAETLCLILSAVSRNINSSDWISAPNPHRSSCGTWKAEGLLYWTFISEYLAICLAQITFSFFFFFSKVGSSHFSFHVFKQQA